MNGYNLLAIVRYQKPGREMSWSIVNFSGGEIIRLAVDIEKAGKLFYEKAAAVVDDQEVKDVLTYLAGEEEKHVSDFQTLGKGLKEDVVYNESYPGEYGDYLKSLIDSHVFNEHNVNDLVRDIKAPREALAIAFRFEKDSIVIFQEFSNVVDANGKVMIDALIAQEKEHIRKIADVARAL